MRGFNFRAATTAFMVLLGIFFMAMGETSFFQDKANLGFMFVGLFSVDVILFFGLFFPKENK